MIAPMHLELVIKEALVAYLLFIPLLTLHEWAHAWVAWKCGDDTAYKLGRVSINPIVHMDLIGTVILPLAGLISASLGAGLIIIGWGKPVPITLDNLKHPRLQDTLIAMAGPAMNLLLAVPLLFGTKFFLLLGHPTLPEMFSQMASLSLMLCFFNLLPFPPLDGSHLILNATRMSYRLYFRLIPVGIVAVLCLINYRPAQNILVGIVAAVLKALAHVVGLDKL